jgi:hypothetical protein
MFEGGWQRILHDGTAAEMAREIARLPHANVTTVPFHFDESVAVPIGTEATNGATPTNGNGNGGNGYGKAPRSSIVLGGGSVLVSSRRTDGTMPIGSVRWREQVCVRGRVQSLRVEPLSGSPSLECTLADESGAVSLVFFGRRHIEGVALGASVTATGMAIEHRGRLAIVNPVYELR